MLCGYPPAPASDAARRTGTAEESTEEAVSEAVVSAVRAVLARGGSLVLTGSDVSELAALAAEPYLRTWATPLPDHPAMPYFDEVQAAPPPRLHLLHSKALDLGHVARSLASRQLVALHWTPEDPRDPARGAFPTIDGYPAAGLHLRDALLNYQPLRSSCSALLVIGGGKWVRETARAFQQAFQNLPTYTLSLTGGAATDLSLGYKAFNAVDVATMLEVRNFYTNTQSEEPAQDLPLWPAILQLLVDSLISKSGATEPDADLR